MSEHPPVIGTDLRSWADALRRYLYRTRSKLVTKLSGHSAAEDGTILWDRTGYPVVSKGDEFRQIVLADGYGMFLRTANQTAAAINTAYAIGWQSSPFGSGAAIDGTDSTKIVFTEEGWYSISFTAQIESSSANAKHIWMWPRINGTDQSGTTMKVTLKENGETTVVSRSAIFYMSAGQYLQAMFAVDDTTLHLHAPTAEAFCPSAPAVTLSVARIRQ